MDEKTKQQLLIAVLFFNIVLMGYMAYQFLIVRNMFVVPIKYGDVFTHIAIGAGIALIPGIIGYFVAGKMYK